jgi:hypothetical protein
VFDRITEEFFQTGLSYPEFTTTGTEDEQKRISLYFRRTENDFSPEEYHVDLTHPVNLIAAATTWCWDCHNFLPLLVRIADYNLNINVKFFNKDHYPFLVVKTNKTEKVPQILFFAKDFYYITRWVERPTIAYQLYAKVHREIGWDKSVSSEFTREYHKQFLRKRKEFGKAFLQEMEQLLYRVDFIQASSPRLFRGNSAQ